MKGEAMRIGMGFKRNAKKNQYTMVPSLMKSKYGISKSYGEANALWEYTDWNQYNWVLWITFCHVPLMIYALSYSLLYKFMMSKISAWPWA